MQLDTYKTFSEIEPSAQGVREAMLDISRYSTSRGAEHEWATRLRFLAPMYDEGTLRWFEETAQEAPGPVDTRSDSLSDDEECSCNDRFWPFLRLTRGLVLLERDTVPDCVHYVAISYCWQSSGQAPYNGEPFAVQCGTSEKSLNCPPALLARVIDICAFYRVSFIWVDQECIDQEDEEDKQVGIQAMDLVYQQADICLGVLEVCLTEQRLVDGLEIMMFARDDFDSQRLSDLLDALDVITSDPWFSRAWCLQEATAGRRNMTLILRYSSHLVVDSLLELCGDIQLELVEMTYLIWSWLPGKLLIRQDLDASVLARGQRFIDWWFRLNVPTFDRNWGEDDDKHVVCNGAEALWFLEKRHNSVVSDRLGIMANLCGYNVRLQTTAVERAGYGFSIAALTLAMLNGDISVLAGYFEKQSGKHQAGSRPVCPDPHDTRAHGFTWCPPGDKTLTNSAFVDRLEDVLRIEVVSLSARGLRVRGCIWVADVKVDLSGIQALLRSRFDDFQIQEALLPDSEDNFELLASTQSMQVREVLVLALTELLCQLMEEGYLALGEYIWRSFRSRGTEKQVKSNKDIKDFNDAPLEVVIDISTRRHKLRPPIEVRLSEDQDDSFSNLRGPFRTKLLTAITQDGWLLLARPTRLDSSADHYRGVSDDAAQLGDCFFTPRNNLGGASGLDSNYEGFPMSWRLQRKEQWPEDLEQTFFCQGLVPREWPQWELSPPVISDVYLL